MKAEVAHYCRTCDTCQKANATIKKPAAPLQPIPVPRQKWSLVGMDLIGPLTITPRGNKYIVALTDHFSKYPVAKAILEKSAHEVAVFVYETTSAYGVFDSVITDQGREFVNSVMDVLTTNFKIDHRISSAYHPQTNGQRERDNRTLKDTLTKYLTDNDNWDDLLPAALFSYRTAVHSSTKVTPFQAMFGETARLPFEVTGKDDTSKEINSEMKDIMNQVNEAMKDRISHNISKAKQKQKKQYDARHTFDSTVKPGDKVLIINSTRIHRMGGKLSPRYLGPYEVVEVLPKGRVRIKNLRSQKILRNLYNMRNLKTYVECAQDPPQSDSKDGRDSPREEASNEEHPRKRARKETVVEFRPVDADWQEERAAALKFSQVCKRHPHQKPVQVPITSKPVDPVPVRGDGNCFFRSISFVLLGEESKHKEIRRLVCDFIDENDAKFFQVTNCHGYVTEKNMRKLGVWATEVEIFAVATLLNTDMYVFTQEAKDREPRWLRYAPIQQINSQLAPSKRAIFISNLHHHFQPVFNVADRE